MTAVAARVACASGNGSATKAGSGTTTPATAAESVANGFNAARVAASRAVVTGGAASVLVRISAARHGSGE